MRKCLVLVVALCTALFSVGAQAASEKQRSVVACTTALAKKNLKPVSAPTATFNPRGNRVTVEGKATGGASYVCETHNNMVISIAIK